MISKKSTVLTHLIGRNTIIKDNCVIGENVTIGNNVTIYPNVTIEDDVYIWDNCVIGRIPMKVSSIYSNVEMDNNKTIIKKGCVVGCGVTIYCGVCIGPQSLIGEHAVIRERTILNGDNIIGPNSFIQKDCRIGSQTRIIQLSSLASGTVIGEHNFISTGFTCVSDKSFGINGYSSEMKGPQIGNNNLIGPNVTILDNITVGNWNLIGAKALVTKSIQDGGVYFGIPARYVKDRKVERL